MSTYQMFTENGLKYTDPQILLTRIRALDAKFNKIRFGKIKKEEVKDSFTHADLYELFGIFYLTQNLKDSFKDITGKIENPYIEVYNYILQLSSELMYEFFVQDREDQQADYRDFNSLSGRKSKNEVH